MILNISLKNNLLIILTHYNYSHIYFNPLQIFDLMYMKYVVFTGSYSLVRVFSTYFLCASNTEEQNRSHFYFHGAYILVAKTVCRYIHINYV